MSEADPARPATSRALRIGVLSPVTGGFFFGEILAGVVREAGRRGVGVALVQTLDAGLTGEASPQEVAGAHPVAWHHLDGFVVSAWAATDDYLQRLHATGKPLVLACTTAPGVDACAVVVDNAAGIAMSIDHLMTHGHTRIAFTGRIEQTDVTERYAAYTAHLPERGVEPLPLIAVSSDVEPGGEAAAAVIADQPPELRCTAVLASTDRVALGLIRGLQRRGLRVPEDVAVIGFDDVPGGWYSDPQLTTVRQRFDEVGALAASVLLDELTTGTHRCERLSVPTTLVRRRSCGCDATVAEPSAAMVSAARAMVSEVDRELVETADPTGRAGAVRTLDETISSALGDLLRASPTPEEIDGFSHVALGLLSADGVPGGAPGIDAGSTTLRHYAMGRIASTLARLQAGRDDRRVNRLSVALGQQYRVGMGLLGNPERDPADLAWLDRVDVAAGCLGLWEGAPGGRLVIAGVHAPDGLLDHAIGTTTTVEDFPPPELLDLADATTGHVAFLIPVRGSSGDHGLLCLVARVEPEYARDRSTFDHWPAFLGAALREKQLLDDLRHSEERYAIAARAANDGLWEWTDGSGAVYVSDRCADLLGLPQGSEVTIEQALSVLHPDDRAALADAYVGTADGTSEPIELDGRVMQADGTSRWVRVRALSASTERGGHCVVGSISDIDQRKQLEDQLREAALIDPVTGLANRRLFLDRLALAMEQPTRRPGARFAVLFLDLDGFKLINDSLGHLAGDDLLRIVGRRLREQVRSVDTAARFGGDEFALLMTDPVPDDLLLVARRIQARIAEPIQLADQEISITASVGITESETTYADAEDVLRDADIAMYRAKESERGTACVFDQAMHMRAMDRLRTRSTITAALASNQFVVHYQPIVDLSGGALTQFEALIRWAHPARGLLLPAEFLPAMEGNSAIITLGRQVIEQVCAQIAAWRTIDDVPVRVSVNLSHREFWSPELLEVIRSALERHRVPPECLVLEITEGVIMSDPVAAKEIMAGMHGAGLKLHIDDFGTGHSSLHALRTFPVDALKIDGSFIRDLGPDQPTALVKAIIAMAAALGLEVVAECVETPEQADQLRDMGCTTAQGWLYSRAVPPDDAGALLGRPLATEHGG